MSEQLRDVIKQPSLKRKHSDDYTASDNYCNDNSCWQRPCKRTNNRKTTSTPGSLYACPFAKAVPEKRYSPVSRHCNAGWPTIHRLKYVSFLPTFDEAYKSREHLRRRHARRFQCLRCFSHYENREKLSDHITTSRPCEIEEYKPWKHDGPWLSEEAHEKLSQRSKKGEAAVTTWERIYKIIFPGAQEIPSPCTSCVDVMLLYANVPQTSFIRKISKHLQNLISVILLNISRLSSLKSLRLP
jgi:hypothetical protein